MVLSLLGLAGLSDAYVEWVSWFEVGIMSHWRDVKDWLLGWVPFSLPWWFLDYLVIGTAYARASVSTSFDHARENAGEELWDREMADMSLVERSLGTALFWLTSVLMWPLFLLVLPSLLLPSSHSHWKTMDIAKLPRKYLARIAWLFLTSLLFFLPILFVLSDFIARFG